jgi:hypothetical protein
MACNSRIGAAWSPCSASSWGYQQAAQKERNPCAPRLLSVFEVAVVAVAAEVVPHASSLVVMAAAIASTTAL